MEILTNKDSGTNGAPVQHPHVPDAGVQIGNRVLSPAVVEAIKNASKQLGQPLPTSPAPTPEPATPEPVPVVEPEPAPPPTKPPLEDVPPHILDAAIRVQRAQEQMDKQRAEMKPDLEMVAKFRPLKDKYGTDQLAAVREAISLLTDQPVDDEIYKLVENYTRQVLQIEPTSESRALSETAKLRAEVQGLKQEQAETQRKALEEAERKKREADEREAIETVGQILAESFAKYPYLQALSGAAKDGTPGGRELVWDEIRMEHERTGQTITVAEAASRVEKTVVERLAPFRALLSQGPAVPAPTEQRRKSEPPRTISASPTPAPVPRTTPPVPGRPLTEEQRRAETLAKIRSALRPG